MSFVAMKKEALFLVCQTFGVDTEESDTKKTLMEKLKTDGITWKMWQNEIGAVEKEEPVVEELKPVSEVSKPEQIPAFKEKMVLLKMNRANPTFEVWGYRFTKDHPYVAVTEAAADYIVNNVAGFAIASPGEAREFYS